MTCSLVTGTGSDLMKRLAAPMIGGMVSSTLLVIPVLSAIWRSWSGFIGAPSVLTSANLSLEEQKDLSVSEKQDT